VQVATWHPRKSVRIRFALVQAGFVAVVIVLLASALYVPVKRRFSSVTNGSYETLAYTLAPSLYDAVQANDRAVMASVVYRVEIQRGVRYVLVTDPSGKVIFDSQTGPDSVEGKTVSTQGIDSLKLQKGDVQTISSTRFGQEMYEYTVPFIVSNKPYYVVRIGVEASLLDGEFTRLSSLFLNLGAIAVVLGAIFAYITTGRLTKPITALTESALAIRAGNLNAYPQVTTNDELEQLAREFKGMVDRLKDFYFKEYTQKEKALVAQSQLQQANERLQLLDRQKTDFMNAASHQLRTPLSVIHWSLSLIVEEAENLTLSADQKQLLTESLSSTKRMVDLVNDLLNISRIEQGRQTLDFAQNNVGKLLNELVGALQPLAMKKNISLSLGEIPAIPDSFFDEKLLYQAFNNFIDNAIKYTPQGGVQVSASVAGNEVNVHVQDTGIGMTEAEQKDLFTRFSRGDEAQKLFPNGSGLGMYVAKSIIERHGGRISLASEKGKGTTFTLTIPLYQQKPATESSNA